jgi:hypothetical protein
VADFFASGAAALVVLVALGLEAAALCALWRRGRSPLTPRAVAAALLPGALLAAALWTALADAHWSFTAVCLAAALPAHLLDLWLRARNA